jgi:hypothetical protein
MRCIRRKGFSDSRRRTSDEGEVHYGAVEAGRNVKDPKPPKWRRLIQLSGKPKSYLERETGIEPATLCLGSRCSTTELARQRILADAPGPADARSRGRRGVRGSWRLRTLEGL